MFSDNLKNAVKDAISTEKTCEKKWKKVGDIAKQDFASALAFDEVKQAFLDEVIYPAMGDETVKVMKMVVPRKGTKDWNAASQTQQDAWAAFGKAKVTERGKGHSYFSRIRDVYAWPEPKVEGDDKPKARDLKTRFNEDLAALIKAGQNAEHPPFDVGMVIGHLESALKYVNK
jgi:hypothetical protein